MTLRKHSFDILLIAAILYTAAVVVSVQQNSYFIDDDYDNFYLTRHDSFWGYVFTRIDDQFVPLHRVFTYLIYKMFPLNFTFAVLVLLTLHLLALCYLRGILKLLHDSSVNKVLMFIYATNVYLCGPLVWWSSGIHRFSYILLVMICIYHYLKYRNTLHRRHLYIAFGAFFTTFGIYSKAVLIPAYLLGLELSLTERRAEPKMTKRLLTLVPFFVASLLHVVWYRIRIPEAFGRFGLDFQFLTVFVVRSFAILVQGLFTAIYNPGNAVLNVLVPLCCVGFFAYTVTKKPSNVFLWLVGLGLISLNFLLIASSPRNFFGIDLTRSYRYYFELTFLVVIFVKLILDNIPAQKALSDLPERVRRALQSKYVQVALIIAYVSLSFVNHQQLMDTRYARYRRAREYVKNLSSGISKLKANPPENLSFIDGTVPDYVTGFKWKMRPYSAFLQIFDLKALCGIPTENFYTISDTGEVRKIE